MSKKEITERKDDIISLLTNPRNKNVRFSTSGRCFKLKTSSESDSNNNNNNNNNIKVVPSNKEIILSGLLPSLKRVFWPEYQYVPSKYGGTTGVRSSFEGRARGTLVHDQLRSYINDKKSVFLKKHSELHFYTKKAIIAMKEWELKPIAAEFIVYDENSRRATSIDALCMDKDYNLVVIDWKCGYDHFLMRASRSMKGPLENKYSDCPLHQAYLQVLIDRVMLERFYGARVSKCYVVQITMEGILYFSPPTDLIENRNILYDYMNDTIKKQKLEEKLKKRRKRVKMSSSRSKKSKRGTISKKKRKISN